MRRQLQETRAKVKPNIRRACQKGVHDAVFDFITFASRNWIVVDLSVENIQRFFSGKLPYGIDNIPRLYFS